MYKVVQKLKRVKIALKELNKEGFSDIKTTKLQAHQRMLNAQTLMHEHLGEEVYAAAVIEAVKEYHLKHTGYLEFLAQKAKLAWVIGGR